jgi:micrococcal nuclease
MSTVNRPPRRYWHEHRGAVFWLISLLIILWRAYFASAPTAPERLEEGVHEVSHVVDGNTLLLASGAQVRLQGVNTPKTVKLNHSLGTRSSEADRFTRDFVEKAGHRVRLTFSLERKDRSDRFLAFVWNGDVMLNEELIRAGLAYARRDNGYSSAMKRRFTQAQGEAKKAGRGFWSKEKETGPFLDAQL